MAPGSTHCRRGNPCTLLATPPAMIRTYLSATIALCLSACGNDSGLGLGPDAGGDVVLPSGGSGLPCEVSALLAANCQTCHGATPSNGAPISLVSFRDLTAHNSNGV